jgi:hypothetical protein
MKRIHKTAILLLTLTCLVSVYAQRPESVKTKVKKSERTETKNDSNGTHNITTIQIDSIVGDSIHSTITTKTTTTRANGNSTETKVVSSTTKTVKENKTTVN